MFTVDDVMRYEAISDNMSWAQLKATNLWKIYLTYSVTKELKNIRDNIELVLAGKIPDALARAYGMRRYDPHTPYKLYLYLRTSLKRIANAH